MNTTQRIHTMTSTEIEKHVFGDAKPDQAVAIDNVTAMAIITHPNYSALPDRLTNWAWASVED